MSNTGTDSGAGRSAAAKFGESEPMDNPQQIHTIERVLTQQCLVILFEFFTIAERLVAQSISKEWMRIARLRRFWSKYQYAFPAPYVDEFTRKYDRRAPDPDWLCQSLGGLMIGVEDFIRPQTFSQIAPFKNIQQLTISMGDKYWGDAADSEPTYLPIDEVRTALRQLRLTSFTCVDFPNSFITEVVFGTAAERATSVSPSSESAATAPTFYGALFAWRSILERFQISSTAQFRRKPTILPQHLFSLMSTTVWPTLSHYQLALGLGTFSFDDESLLGLRQLFTRTCLPSLVALQFRLSLVQESFEPVCTILTERLKDKFYDLQELDMGINVREKNSKPVTVPPLPFCFTSLIRITVTDELTHIWLKSISACASLTYLSVQKTIHPDVNQVNFFLAIHQLPIRTLELPFFHASSDDTHLGSTLLGDGAGALIRECFSRMVSLTRLSLINFSINLPYHHNEWLFHLDHLSQLASFSCSFQLNGSVDSPPTMSDQLSIKYASKMLECMTRMVNLTSLTLTEFGPKDLEEFNCVWFERVHSTRSIQNGTGTGATLPIPIPIHSLHLRNLHLTNDSPSHMFQLVHQLRHFTRLTNLTIEVASDHSTDSETDPSSHCFYRELDQCPSLRSLHLLSRGELPPSQRHQVDDATLRHWCNSGQPRPRSDWSTSAGKEEEVSVVVTERTITDHTHVIGDDGCKSRLVDGSSTKFPNLESLEFSNSNVDSSSIVDLYVLPRLRQLYWTRRRKHSDLNNWLIEKTRQLRADAAAAAAVGKSGSIRPPMHQGFLLPVKIDRLTCTHVMSHHAYHGDLRR